MLALDAGGESEFVRTELGVNSDPFSVRRPDFAFNILLKNSRKAS